jgi:hypothetical protein
VLPLGSGIDRRVIVGAIPPWSGIGSGCPDTMKTWAIYQGDRVAPSAGMGIIHAGEAGIGPVPDRRATHMRQGDPHKSASDMTANRGRPYQKPISYPGWRWATTGVRHDNRHEGKCSHMTG